MEKVSINREKNEVTLRFNSMFYNQEYINGAIKEFSQICDVKEEKDFFILTPKKEVDIEKLGYEFYNYVLGLIKNM